MLRLMIFICLVSSIARAQVKTFCNPLDLDYGFRSPDTAAQPYRHGADPVIVLFNNRYYLFSTWDRPGYRVSDDLIDWTFIPFAKDSDLFDHVYTAAAVIVLDDQLIYTESGNTKKPAAIYRTRDPDSGRWEKVADLPPYSDPCLFLDPKTSKLFLYHGLDKPIRGVELDRSTLAPISERQLIPPIDTAHIRDGWEVCTEDNAESSPPMRGNKTFLPCREGSWMTFYNNTYYLQYASPGTTVCGYADGLFTSDSPLGPFTYSQFSPISRKASGFISSAGHSCLFQDRHGNWWRTVTMLIGVRQRMERRIGLFPAGFDADGIPYTRTDLGDLPITLASARRDHLKEIHPNWWPVHQFATVTASSALDDVHSPNLAADENIRTWWSAKSDSKDEWLQLDLGQSREMTAIQVNFAEQDCRNSPTASDEPHRFTLAASSDGRTWSVIADRSTSTKPSPHGYIPLPTAISARYLKLQNISSPAGGRFAVADLRVFAAPWGPAPAPVDSLTAAREPGDRRSVTLKWNAVPGAGSYLLRYGIQTDKLYQHQLIPASTATFMLHALNNDPPYHFRLDTMSAAGMTPGASIVTTP